MGSRLPVPTQKGSRRHASQSRPKRGHGVTGSRFPVPTQRGHGVTPPSSDPKGVTGSRGHASQSRPKRIHEITLLIFDPKSRCHGPKGHGVTPATWSLLPRPAPLPGIILLQSSSLPAPEDLEDGGEEEAFDEHLATRGPGGSREGKGSLQNPKTLSAASLNSCTGSLEEGARATNLQGSGILSERPARMIEDVRVEEGHDEHLGQRVGPGVPGRGQGDARLSRATGEEWGRQRGALLTPNLAASESLACQP